MKSETFLKRLSSTWRQPLIYAIIVIGAYVVTTRWVLPTLGIGT